MLKVMTKNLNAKFHLIKSIIEISTVDPISVAILAFTIATSAAVLRRTGNPMKSVVITSHLHKFRMVSIIEPFMDNLRVDLSPCPRCRSIVAGS